MRAKSFKINHNSRKKYDSDCMQYERNQSKNELLLDYRFNDITFHSIEYDPEWQVICFGTSKGTILNFFIKIGDDVPYFDTFEDSQTSFKKDKIIANIVNDSETK